MIVGKPAQHHCNRDPLVITGSLIVTTDGQITGDRSVTAGENFHVVKTKHLQLIPLSRQTAIKLSRRVLSEAPVSRTTDRLINLVPHSFNVQVPPLTA